MNREYHQWYSPALGRNMELLVFGHAGARVLVFPTSMGRFFQWEDSGMIDALHAQIEQGWLQLYCVDSIDGESWYNKSIGPSARAWRQVQYNHYLTDEVLPFMTQRNNNPFLISTGASFGAYHAVNFAFLYPQIVRRVIGMSGLYDISRFADFSSDQNVYFNNPPAFIANEHEPARLHALQSMDIILAVGHDDSLCASSEALSGVLWNKGIGNALRIWDGWAHDWPWWQQMIRLYISGHD